MQKLLLVLLTLSFFNPVISQTLSDDLAKAAEDHNMVGMSVLTVCNGEIDNEFYFGKADLNRDIDVSDSTMYRIASISKTVTATVAMQLYEDGLLDLEENISDIMGYVIQNPNFPDVSITPAMLLSHTSTLVDGNGYGNFLSATYNQVPPISISELVVPGGSYYTNDMWNNIEPGAYFNYSNINFGLLATVMEKVSGKRFDKLVKGYLLDPLEIKGSYNVRDIENIDNVAVLYRNANPQADNYQGVPPGPLDMDDYVPGTNGVFFAPQGGLRVSARDLAKIMQLHIRYGEYEGQQLLDSSTLALMHTPVWTYNGSNGNNYFNLFNTWGLGIQRTINNTMGDIVVDGYNFYGHPGEAYGLISDMYFEKDYGFGVIFMTNGYYGTGGYNFGEYSAFYTAEESVFSAIEEHVFQGCQLVNNLEEASLLAMEAFPNPFRHNLVIRSEEWDTERVDLEVSDMFGRVVWNGIVSLDGGKYVFSAEGLSSGVYNVVVRDEGRVYGKKVVKF